MSASDEPVVRRAQIADADAIGELLHAFNSEFGDPTPGPRRIAERMRKLLASGETAALLAGPGPDGLAVLRFRPAIFSDGLECYLAELYVVPASRGRGLGRALMDAAIALAREQGADHMELDTTEADVAACALYESVGLRKRSGAGDGALSLHYEREL